MKTKGLVPLRWLNCQGDTLTNVVEIIDDREVAKEKVKAHDFGSFKSKWQEIARLSNFAGGAGGLTVKLEDKIGLVPPHLGLGQPKLIHPVLAHRSTPQGCPFSLVVLCLTSGVNFVEAYAGQISDRHLAIYVDNRTFTTRTLFKEDHIWCRYGLDVRPCDSGMGPTEKMVAAGKLPKWRSKPHTGLNLLQKDLHRLGWKVSEPWIWHRNETWFSLVSNDDRKADLSARSKQPLEMQLHILRLAYKQNCFEKILKQERRDAKLFLGQHSITDLRGYFIQISLDDTWKHLATTDGSGRACCLGRLEARCVIPGARKIQSRLSLCANANGSHEHLFWEALHSKEGQLLQLTRSYGGLAGLLDRALTRQLRCSYTCVMWLRPQGTHSVPRITKVSLLRILGPLHAHQLWRQQQLWACVKYVPKRSFP